MSMEVVMATLDEDVILNAVVDVIEDGGVEAFSMRALSRSLGVTATAIYYHFENKQALLDAAAIFTTSRLVSTAGGDGPWDHQIHQLLKGAADEALRQPRTFAWLLSAYAKEPPLRVVDEAVLALLIEGGLSLGAAYHAKGALMRLVVGHITLTSGARSRPAGSNGRKDEVALPLLAGIESEKLEFDADEVLERAIAGVIASFDDGARGER